MSNQLDRSLYMKAVFEGQISSEYITKKEFNKLFHDQADVAIDNAMYEQMYRDDVCVFDLDWDYKTPHWGWQINLLGI